MIDGLQMVYSFGLARELTAELISPNNSTNMAIEGPVVDFQLVLLLSLLQTIAIMIH